MARDNEASGYLKGYPVVIAEYPAGWGAGEGLPDFIQLTISDATLEGVEHFLNDWPLRYTHSIVMQNASGYRLLVEVDPDYISASNVGKDQIKNAMQEWVSQMGGTVNAFSSNSMTFDIPKPVNLQELKADFDDKFKDVLDIRRYYFGADAVNAGIAAGGQITLTKAQALAKLIDKLAE
jgi:hypothetical protein